MSFLTAAGKLFHSGDLVDDDNVLTRDENGEDPGYNALGPTGRTELAGDHDDDDGQALDDEFTPNPQGIPGVDDTPLEPDLLTDAPVVESPRQVVNTPFGHRIELSDQDVPEDVGDECTRLLLSRVPIGTDGAGNTYPPQMLFPRDPNRVHLAFTGDDQFQWGSNKSDVYSPGLFPATLGLILDRHTGAVWIYAPNAATGSYVNGWAVTS